MVQSIVTANAEASEAEEPASGAEPYYSYETFGVRFFEHAISPERIRDAMSGLAGRSIQFGPKSLGPARLIRVTASGRIGEVTVTRRAGDVVAYRLVIPANLDLNVRLAGQSYRFHADMWAGLTVTARAAEPLRVIIDVAPPSADDVEVMVQARGFRAAILRATANVDGELRRFVARYLSREIEKPHIMRLRDIDVTTHLDIRKVSSS